MIEKIFFINLGLYLISLSVMWLMCIESKGTLKIEIKGFYIIVPLIHGLICTISITTLPILFILMIIF